MQNLQKTSKVHYKLGAYSHLNCKTSLHMLMDYIDTCIKICLVIMVGELLRRMLLVARERIWFMNHYELNDGLWTIFRRTFSCNHLTIFFALAIGILIFIRFVMTEDFVLPPLNWFPYITLYWIFMIVNVGYSNLSNAEWLRESHGLDYAEGMASNYFHGYLKLTLPSHTGHLGLRQRIEDYEARQRVQFAIKRLVILIPNTMFVNSKIESKILTRDGVAPLETIVKNRAGVARPFKNDVYRFTIPINGTHFYVAMEGATPMLSFFEAMSFQLSTTWQMKEMKREILLKFCKHLKKLLKEWPETQDEAEVILYNAYRNDGRSQDVGEVLLSHLTSMWNEGRA